MPATTLPKAERMDAFSGLVQGAQAALETYSNVHRGSGHHSRVSTHLFEQAREIVLEHLGVKPDKHLVVFMRGLVHGVAANAVLDDVLGLLVR